MKSAVVRKDRRNSQRISAQRGRLKLLPRNPVARMGSQRKIANLRSDLSPAKYTVGQIVNWLLQKAENSKVSLSSLKLQQLVYLAHAHHIVEKKIILVNEEAHACANGPVFQSILSEYKRFGSGNIPSLPFGYMKELVYKDDRPVFRINVISSDDQDKAIDFFLGEIWDKYYKYSNSKILEISCKNDEPWDISWKKAKQYNLTSYVISNDLLLRNFKIKI